MTGPKTLFVTGRLAESALRQLLSDMAPRLDFEFDVAVLPITVAALMTPEWIARKLPDTAPFERIIIPGYCHGDLTELAKQTGTVVETGPRDLRELPRYFGKTRATEREYGEYSIEIIAEINHAPRLTLAEIMNTANNLRNDGADIIDVGCDPGSNWSGVAACVRALVAEGHRVSIDSFNPTEIGAAVKEGAELVLSVNSGNVDAAADWGCEVVAIPDVPENLDSLDATVEKLTASDVPYRLDPILEPIGFGFAQSLGRYLQTRERYPSAKMMMGIGNLTELTDVDSAGVNTLLLGFCQETGIHSVLTTQVISWAATSVRECDLARRLMHFAIHEKVPPKHIEARLVMLRDTGRMQHGEAQLAALAAEIKDNNYRVFAENGEVHLVSNDLHLHAADPFLLFEQLLTTEPKNVDASHAFYLGYEMAKALVAITVGKQYTQDESLNWGFLTREEVSHRLSKKQRKRKNKS